MLFDDAQSYTAFESNCRLAQSVTSPISLDADTSLSISEIIIKNMRGPKTVPSGTPLNIMVVFTNTPRQSYKMVSVNKEVKQPNTNISNYPNCSDFLQKDLIKNI